MVMKRPIGARVAAPAATATAPAAVLAADNVISVTVSRSFTLKIGYEYRKFGVEVQATSHELASSQVDELIMLEAEKSNEQFALLATANDEITNTSHGTDDEETEGAADEGDEGAADITAEDIMALSRDELVQFIEDNSLELDDSTFKKNKAGLELFRQAVVDAVFEAETDDTTDDEAGTESDEEEAEISEDDINAMSREELVELIDGNSLEINHAKISKLSALRAAVIEAISEPEADADSADAGEEEEEEGEAYTEESLAKLKIADLKAIYEAWELGKFPAGTPIIQHKLAKKRILQYQETGK